MSAAHPARWQRMAPVSIPGSRCHGFTYPVVLGLLLTLSISAAVGVELASTQARREKEAELLFRGQAYAAAIRAYYLAVPGQKRYPPSLEDLLRDPRFAHRRHLRALYQDPFGKDWLLIRAPDGGIAGVASGSRQTPLKKAGFVPEFKHFEAANSYREWQFVYVPSRKRP